MGTVRMGTVARAAGVGIAIVAFNGQIKEANRMMCMLLGFDESELKQKTLCDLSSPEHYSECHDLFKQLTMGLCEEFDLELRMIRCDRQPVWVHLTGSLIPGTRALVLTVHDSSDYFDLKN